MLNLLIPGKPEITGLDDLWVEVESDEITTNFKVNAFPTANISSKFSPCSARLYKWPDCVDSSPAVNIKRSRRH